MGDAFIKTRTHEKIAIISLHGSFLMGEVDDLRNTITDFHEKGLNHFLLDLSETRIMQSHVIGQLLNLSQEILNDNGKICLINPNERVQFVLHLTRVSDIIPIFETHQEGLDYLSSPR